MMIDNCVITWWTKNKTALQHQPWKQNLQPQVWRSKILYGSEGCYICRRVRDSEGSFIYIDNQAAIVQLESESGSCKSKHVDIRLKYAKEWLNDGKLKAKYTETKNQLVDIFSKALPKKTLEDLRTRMWIKI
jgi:hypothetical protein